MDMNRSHERVWQQFAERYQLTLEQLSNYQRYYALLSAANKEYDLTAITDFESTIAYHFADSLEIGKCLKDPAWFDTISSKSLTTSGPLSAHAPATSPTACSGVEVCTRTLDLRSMKCLVDVGTGAGFPGLALKIKYPHLNIILIEVLHKRINFLQSVIDDLKLTDIAIYTNDWRTFLRKTNYPAELITSRASLHPDELLRMFQPSSPYKNALLAYWASHEWQPAEKEAAHILKTCEYQVKDRTRKYVIFK